MTKKQIENMVSFLNDNDISFELTVYGCNYFKNVPSIAYDGIMVSAEANQYQVILGYCRKHRLAIIQQYGKPGCTVINILAASEAVTLNLYINRMQASVRSCENEIHVMREYFGRPTPEENEICSGIMEFHGEELKRELA